MVIKGIINIPIISQPIVQNGYVEIGDECVLGARIGRNCVIGKFCCYKGYSRLLCCTNNKTVSLRYKRMAEN